MTQALVSLGFGAFGSIGQVVLVGMGPISSTSDPIAWIEFTASGVTPACSSVGAVSQSSTSGMLSAVACTGRESTATTSADIPTATITGRPYA